MDERIGVEEEMSHNARYKEPIDWSCNVAGEPNDVVEAHDHAIGHALGGETGRKQRR